MNEENGKNTLKEEGKDTQTTQQRVGLRANRTRVGEPWPQEEEQAPQTDTLDEIPDENFGFTFYDDLWSWDDDVDCLEVETWVYLEDLWSQVRTGEKKRNAALASPEKRREKLSLKDIRQEIGITEEEEDEEGKESEKQEMLTLEEIRRRMNQEYITDWDEIKRLLDRAVRMRADYITSRAGDWLGNAWQSYQLDVCKKGPPLHDIRLLDVMVFCSWFDKFFSKSLPVKTLRANLLQLARKDPRVLNLMDVSAATLLRRIMTEKFKPKYTSGRRQIVMSMVFPLYRRIFGQELWDDVTLGELLAKVGKSILAGWNPDDETSEKYADRIRDCYDLLQELVDNICLLYVKVEERVEQKDFPFRLLREKILEDLKSTEIPDYESDLTVISN